MLYKSMVTFIYGNLSGPMIIPYSAKQTDKKNSQMFLMRTMIGACD